MLIFHPFQWMGTRRLKKDKKAIEKTLEGWKAKEENYCRMINTSNHKIMELKEENVKLRRLKALAKVNLSLAAELGDVRAELDKKEKVEKRLEIYDKLV